MHSMDVQMGVDAEHIPAVLHWADDPQSCNIQGSLPYLQWRLY